MGNDVYLSAKDTATLLNVSTRSIQGYKEKGIPITDSKPPKYPAREVVLWAIKNGVIDFALSTATSAEHEALPPRERKDLADAQLKELLLAEKRGELISIEEVRKEIEFLLVSSRNKVLAMPHKLAPIVITCETTAEAFSMITDACYDALNDLSRLEDKDFEEYLVKKAQRKG
jgi:phage terminase Nu1 subunit (DNA packaging protein)